MWHRWYDRIRHWHTTLSIVIALVLLFLALSREQDLLSAILLTAAIVVVVSKRLLIIASHVYADINANPRMLTVAGALLLFFGAFTKTTVTDTYSKLKSNIEFHSAGFDEANMLIEIQNDKEALRHLLIRPSGSTYHDALAEFELTCFYTADITLYRQWCRQLEVFSASVGDDTDHKQIAALATAAMALDGEMQWHQTARKAIQHAANFPAKPEYVPEIERFVIGSIETHKTQWKEDWEPRLTKIQDRYLSLRAKRQDQAAQLLKTLRWRSAASWWGELALWISGSVLALLGQYWDKRSTPYGKADKGHDRL